jgi:hypothetical protein
MDLPKSQGISRCFTTFWECMDTQTILEYFHNYARIVRQDEKHVNPNNFSLTEIYRQQSRLSFDNNARINELSLVLTLIEIAVPSIHNASPCLLFYTGRTI